MGESKLTVKTIREIVSRLRACSIPPGVVENKSMAQRMNRKEKRVFGDKTHAWKVGDEFYTLKQWPKPKKSFVKYS